MLITVKIGGDLLKKGFPDNLASEIKKVTQENNVILVHGGGDIVTEISEKLGHPPRFVTSPRGFRSRYTDKDTSRIYTMVMAGKINKDIVSVLQGHGVQALGLSGLDGALIRANRKDKIIIIDERGRRRLIDGGYTGQVTSVNIELINLLLENNYIPVLSAIAISEKNEALNVDGDRLAANVALNCRAEKLVLLTDVEGLYLNERIIDELYVSEAKRIVNDIGPGMITKVYASIEALEGGVKEVVIASGLKDEAITSAIENKSGTLIKR